jgi:hypothetical protein
MVLGPEPERHQRALWRLLVLYSSYDSLYILISNSRRRANFVTNVWKYHLRFK